MDDSKAPPTSDRPLVENNSPDSLSSAEMAALVAPNNPALLPVSPAPPQGVSKRYRPAPAKTFQCRGFGDCRMVFSRSEHLARHIRKHTGERPFTCHCSKQFSRLDNLRQHAQTVHADKQDQNERMMRDLTSLHASMAAANKATQSRAKRPSQHPPVDLPLDPVKEEDLPIAPIHYRPGTTAGYESSDALVYPDSWASDPVPAAGGSHRHPRQANPHSFRDSTQSFRIPPTTSSTPFFNHHHSQSFLPLPPSPFSFSLPTSRDGRPGSSSSRPTTATASLDSSASHPRSLPPLSAVVSASIAPSPPQPPFPLLSTSNVLPLPATAAFSRRPLTASRPGTAPASFFAPPKPAYVGGPGLVHHPDFSLSSYGRSSDLAPPAPSPPASCLHPGPTAGSPFDPDPPSPTTGTYDSMFSFHPPALSDPSPPNPRKRPFAGPDEATAPLSSLRRDPISAPGLDDYGSESRPQSRRLTVLELCNDPDTDGGLGSFLPATTAASRPNTSSGLCSSASALALVDRPPSSSVTAPSAGSPLFSGAPPPPVSATSPAAAAAGGGGRLSPRVQRESTTSPSPPYAYPLRGVLRAVRESSRTPPTTCAAALPRRGDPLPQREHQQQQQQQRQRDVRSPSVANAYSPTAVGMKA